MRSIRHTGSTIKLNFMCKNIGCVLFFLSLFTISGCATITPAGDRYSVADKLAANSAFQKIFLKTDDFILTSYYKIKKPGAPVSIYIEGDGSAWQTKTRLSQDPTPKNPLLLRLASLDNSDNIAYIARPGQYCENQLPSCDASYWAGKRFSEEVVRSVDQAITDLLNVSGAQKVHLIGYSGGAAIAVLVAARRRDILTIRTVAGNLDPEALNKHHGVSPLKNSLNPTDAALTIKHIPQYHFAGEKDSVVPFYIAERFLDFSGNPENIKIIVITDATHSEGWDKKWKEMLGSSAGN